MASEHQSISRVKDREIIITRVFDAPRELLFEAWTDPKHVAHWWGPTGFRTTTTEFDFRPGGVWRHIMHGPDGTDYPNKTIFIEIAKPERLVYTNGWDKADAPEPLFQATVTFEKLGTQTKVTLRSVFKTAEALQEVIRDYKAEEGGRQHLARLAEYVARMPH